MSEYFSIPELLANNYWKDKRFAFDGSDNLIYLGVNRESKASEAEGTWLISKFTWTGTNLTRIQGPLSGAWNNRTTLDW